MKSIAHILSSKKASHAQARIREKTWLKYASVEDVERSPTRH